MVNIYEYTLQLSTTIVNIYEYTLQLTTTLLSWMIYKDKITPAIPLINNVKLTHWLGTFTIIYDNIQ